jgi:hypothetical protein
MQLRGLKVAALPFHFPEERAGAPRAPISITPHYRYLKMGRI